ncbi:MAG TPA: response regulator, partial [Polyangiaceae bacterium]|nr:response regulator [Polyangiaceae bacterium]
MSTDREAQGTVVVVDDEAMVLRSLETYLGLETDFRVVTFTSAQAALEHLATEDADVVISDFLMPEMDGISFLARVRELRPEVPRVILTGYADKENAIKAINEVGLYQYLEKPWNNDDLRLVVRNGIEKKRLIDRLAAKVREVSVANDEL